MRRLVGTLATLLLVLPAGVGAVTPAAGRAAPAAEPHRPAGVRAVITFDKDARHPWRSRIRWRAMRQRDGAWRVVDAASWRAGSGLGGPGTTDACHRDVGWLPNGTYSFVQHDDYHGNLIRGRAFYLGAKRCGDGTWRTDLFIHTESGAGNRQCADAPGDQVCRWEYPRINDYRSHGCIKMSPGDLLDLVRHYHRWFRAEVRYPTSRVAVRVRS
jgi:hypothetical protein